MNVKASVFLIAASIAVQPLVAQNLVAGNAANRTSGPGGSVPGSLLFATLSGGGSFPPPVTFDPAYTTVAVNGSSVPVIGSDGQRGIIFRLPPDTPIGYLTIDVTLRPQGKAIGTWRTSGAAVASNFGLYTVGNGYGPASATNAITGAAVNMENPAHPGDIVSVWGTGLGNATADQVSILLGGHTAQVLYAGPALGLTGVDQVNFTVPNDPSIPDGCFVALQATTQSLYLNNIATLPKASVPGPFNSPYAFSADTISLLESGVAVNTIVYQIQGLSVQNRRPYSGTPSIFKPYRRAIFYLRTMCSTVVRRSRPRPFFAAAITLMMSSIRLPEIPRFPGQPVRW